MLVFNANRTINTVRTLKYGQGNTRLDQQNTERVGSDLPFESRKAGSAGLWSEIVQLAEGLLKWSVTIKYHPPRLLESDHLRSRRQGRLHRRCALEEI